MAWDQLKNIRRKKAFWLKGKFEHNKILAEDVMTRPIFLYIDDTIETILGKLQTEEVDYCIVVDENKKFVWEVTDEMLLKIIAHAAVNEPLVEILDIGYKRWINHTQTKDYIRKHKNTVYSETPFFDIMKLIDKKWFQYIPVIDKDKKVIGVITPSSILRFILHYNT